MTDDTHDTIRPARLKSIQTAYLAQLQTATKSAAQLIAEVNSINEEECNQDVLQWIVTGTLQHKETSNQNISSRLKANWKWDRLDIVTIAILQCAIFEIMHNLWTNPAIIISEYLTVGSELTSPQDLKFINAILDDIAKTYRKEDMIKAQEHQNKQDNTSKQNSECAKSTTVPVNKNTAPAAFATTQHEEPEQIGK